MLLRSPFLKPLHRAEAPFLQVLLERFTLVRRGKGSELRVHFYRDVAPIGCTIANGSCDNREELLNPSRPTEARNQSIRETSAPVSLC